MENLNIALIQTTLFWEDPDKNIQHFSKKIAGIDQPVDLIVLPEVFSTGFTRYPAPVAEPMEGKTMQWMHHTAREKACVVAGSMVIEEHGRYYNRFVWMKPDGNYQTYDKKHLFSHAGEDEHYTAGDKRMVAKLKGWKILPLICYDIRFPIYSRNRYSPENGFDYDVLLYVANWPANRSHTWRVLMMARAMENMCYVVGVNRIGSDDRGIEYTGDTAVVDSMGETLFGELPNTDHVGLVTLPRCPLDSHREKFRVWEDWDAV